MESTPPPANDQPGTAPGKSRPGLRSRFRAWWNHAFNVEPYDETSLNEADRDVLQRLADSIHAKRMTAAAILWAHSHRHLNFIGSSAMLFIQPFFEMTHPFVNAVLKRFGAEIPPEDYPKLALALEKRYSIEYFVQRLEANADKDYNNRLAQGSGEDTPGEKAANSDTDGPNG